MAHSADTHAVSDDHHHDGEFSHPASLMMLFVVFFSLLGLTVLTVWQSTLDIGEAELWITLLIATVKAGLVMAFFMHMIWDKPLNIIFFFSSIIFVSLFLGFTLMDAHGYHDQIEDKDTLADSIPVKIAAKE